MRRYIKIFAAVLGLSIVAYYASLVVEGISGPPLPASAAKFERHAAELDAIVDSHWDRSDAIATQDELNAYQNLIDELSKFDYAPVQKRRDQVEALQSSVRARYDARIARAGAFYRSLVASFGHEGAAVATQLVHGPTVAAAESQLRAVNRHQSRASLILHLRSSTRYHLAMAHALRGEEAAAVEQLKLVLKETPEYGQINASYIIGARVHAEKDPDFMALLDAAGGSSQRFLDSYVNDGSPNRLYPFYGTRLHDPL